MESTLTLRTSNPFLRFLAIFGVMALSMACGGGGGSGGGTSNPAPKPPVISTFTVFPPTIASAQDVSLRWSVSSATELQIDPGAIKVTGTDTSFHATATTTYTLTAANADGKDTAQATVTLTPPGSKPVITAFSAFPSTITPGQGSILNWTVSSATQLSIAPSVGGVTGLSSKNVNPAVTTTYTLTARNASGQSATANTTVTVNATPVTKLYPTAASGREWTLPDLAAQTDPTDEWHPFLGKVSDNPTPGEFHVTAKPDTGETRLEVRSPVGKRWWKNIEATWYVKRGADSGPRVSSWWERHWTIIARGERHQNATTTKIGANGINTINGQGTPPPDTQDVWPTWPWYPVIADTFVVAEPALATSYDTNLYPGDATYGSSGRTLFEKELTHPNGYANNPAPQNRGSVTPADWSVGTPNWVGLKMVVRNFLSDASKVHLEAWVDRDANGSWVLQSQYDDVPGWAATTLDASAGSTPYNYPLDMVITWAGPYVTFRADLMDFDMKWNSIREIDPLP